MLLPQLVCRFLFLIALTQRKQQLTIILFRKSLSLGQSAVIQFNAVKQLLPLPVPFHIGMKPQQQEKCAGQQAQGGGIQHGAERKLIQGKNNRKDSGKQAQQQERQDMLPQIAEKEGTSGFVLHTGFLLIPRYSRCRLWF